MKKLEVIFVNQSMVAMPKKFLSSWIAACARELKKTLPKTKAARLRGELTVVFLDLKEARRTNLQFRGRDYATDVLSFDSEGFGELILCPQVIAKQAREHGLSFKEELGYMVLHGILHLLGYDHEKSKTAEKTMLSLQDHVFEKLI